MLKTSTITAAALAAAFGLTSALPATAQQQQQQMQQQQQLSADDITNQQLKSYVAAALEIQTVRQEFQSQMANVETQEDQQAVQQEASQKMISEIEDAGLSVDEYNAIATAVRSDPELSEKVQKMAEQAR